jgi:RimJ/RimL family protein N-acetyltransferase
MDWRPGLELSSPAVILRPYRRGDEIALYQAARESVREINPWLPWCHSAYTLKESAEWIEGCEKRWVDDESYDFAVWSRATGLYCGGCSINQIRAENRFANLGYWVRTSETGRGVATEAVRLVAAFGLTELDLRRLEIVIAAGNEASARVAEKAGAVLEGTCRNRLYFHGESHDALVYSLVTGDLESRT